MKRLIPILALVLAACSGATPAAPTAEPTPFVAPTVAPTPTPKAGSGVVTFGRAGTIDKETLKINPTKDSFAVSVKKIAWSAEFVEPAGATRLTFVIAKVGSGGTESGRVSFKIDISNPTFNLLSATEDLSGYVNRKPGTYVLRILRGGTILAEGQFRLTK